MVVKIELDKFVHEKHEIARKCNLVRAFRFCRLGCMLLATQRLRSSCWVAKSVQPNLRFPNDKAFRVVPGHYK